MIYVIATLGIKPGTAAQVFEAASACIAATRKEKGCIDYNLMQNMGDENTLMFVERWTNRAALEAHFDQPHLIAWREAAAKFVIDKKLEIIDPAQVDAS